MMPGSAPQRGADGAASRRAVAEWWAVAVQDAAGLENGGRMGYMRVI
jgi:hypothetical protein